MTSTVACCPACVEARADSVRAADASLKAIACTPLHLALSKALHAVSTAATAITTVA